MEWWGQPRGQWVMIGGEGIEEDSWMTNHLSPFGNWGVSLLTTWLVGPIFWMLISSYLTKIPLGRRSFSLSRPVSSLLTAYTTQVGYVSIIRKCTNYNPPLSNKIIFITHSIHHLYKFHANNIYCYKCYNCVIHFVA